MGFVLFRFLQMENCKRKRNLQGFSLVLKFQGRRGRMIKLIKANGGGEKVALRCPFDYYYNDLNGSMPCGSVSKTKKTQ